MVDTKRFQFDIQILCSLNQFPLNYLLLAENYGKNFIKVFVKFTMEMSIVLLPLGSIDTQNTVKQCIIRLFFHKE